MRKKVDYLPLCERALTLLEVISKATEYMKRYEMHQSFDKSLVEIEELTQVAPLTLEKNILSNLHRALFESLMEQVALVEDELHEVLMCSGDLMKKLGRLTAEDRNEICEILNVEYVPVEDRMSHELKDVLFHLLDEIHKLNQSSSKYYSFDEERFVEFEDEVNPEE
ncbi:hypothetical protein HYV86_01430 [Candidatus Woesearchaeota archaeon]|nr:hypothetical protein [Candidatus Woesearchaeota archaeon]